MSEEKTPTQAPTNTYSTQFNEMAIVTGVLCVVFTPAALITGIISLRQIKKSNERGRGIAITGVVLGGAIMALFALLLIFFIILAATGNLDSTTSTPSYYN